MNQNIGQTIYVLDTTVFAEKQASKFVGSACVTVLEVAEELKSLDAKIEFDRLQHAISIIEPEKEFVAKVEAIVKKTNDKVSQTDKKVVALALHFKSKKKEVVLVSDDYSVQNLAKTLGIQIKPLSQKGIKQTLEWKRKCKACGREILGNAEECAICGSAAKFVPRSPFSFQKRKGSGDQKKT